MKGELRIVILPFAFYLLPSLVFWPITSTPLYGQPPPAHYLQRADLPPGTIGRAQLLRGGPRAGYFQPVRIAAPAGAMVSLAMDGQFQPPRAAPLNVGMLIGPVYRLQVTRIPLNEGMEVYPTIEVIDRLYPPAGQTRRFPIPIYLTQEELELALSGRLVTRIIYLEEPRSALPFLEDSQDQRWFEVAADQDPLQVADRLGRPVAILRMGSRLPELSGPDAAFLFGSPPFVHDPQTLPAPAKTDGTKRRLP